MPRVSEGSSVMGSVDIPKKTVSCVNHSEKFLLRCTEEKVCVNFRWILKVGLYIPLPCVQFCTLSYVYSCSLVLLINHANIWCHKHQNFYCVKKDFDFTDISFFFYKILNSTQTSLFFFYFLNEISFQSISHYFLFNSLNKTVPPDGMRQLKWKMAKIFIDMANIS